MKRFASRIAGLGWWFSLCLETQKHASAGTRADEAFPETPYVIDVTRPPYGARGDGTTDDTESLQRAIQENTGRHRVLYFPRGTYLISRTLTWPKKWEGHDNWGFTTLHGQNTEGCVLKLKAGTFTDPAKPQAMMWCGGFGSADWFHNYVENLTFDIGQNNAGAIALQFYSNNSGAVRRCRFLAREGGGMVGLDLGHRDMNGPLLVRDCEVLGFRRGVSTSGSVNSQTFEHLRLSGQTELGFENAGQAISLRGLVSDNTVPALKSYGSVALIDAWLRGQGSSGELPAVINYNGGGIYLRDVSTSGYGRALADTPSPDTGAALRIRGEDKPGSLGPIISEYSSREATGAMISGPLSIRLPIEEAPDLPWDAPSDWSNVDAFGADPSGAKDSSPAVQRAMDSGATTIFLPGSYNLASTVILRGRVRRVIGLGGMISYGDHSHPNFRVQDGPNPVIQIEHFGYVGGGIELARQRTVIIRSVSDCELTSRPEAQGGRLFLEDFVSSGLNLRHQRVWARQLNIENEGTHLINDGGNLWILGYKTERGGTLLSTQSGGQSEVLGGFSYTTTAGKLAPMFENIDSSVFTFFSEVCYNGDPFSTLVHEVHGQRVQWVRRGDGHTAPYTGRWKLPQ